ncbi:nucleotide disphospho-sugar-binding domain-containing protein, partial [Nocardiopsis ansamitocini]|uniref:nucleotide disphospho-sugar-binding domain-containing protein n=1 Tax=Nocardiopsis ansamitocini TaxID=1670832 RepID=UPI0025556FD7
PPFGRAGDPAEEISWEYLRDGYRRVVPWWWRMVNDPMVDDLVALCRQWRPDLVIWGSVSYAGAIAARACGAAHVRFLWGADIFSRMRGLFLRRMGEQPPDQQEDPLAAWLAGLAARYGLDYDEELVHGQATVESVPPSLRVDGSPGVRYLPTRYVPYNGRAVVPHWLRTPPHRPRICLTLGTTVSERAKGEEGVALGDVVAGLAELDAEIVATLPAEQQQALGPVPGNVRLVDYVPLHALVPTCDAMISHGGWGTVLNGLVSGVPQLIVPSWFDNPLLARRLAAQGAVLAIPGKEVTGQNVREHVARLLTERTFAQGSRRLSAEMLGMPAPGEVVGQLCLLARERSGPAPGGKGNHVPAGVVGGTGRPPGPLAQRSGNGEPR